MTLDECKAAVGRTVTYTLNDTAMTEYGVLTGTLLTLATVRFPGELLARSVDPSRLALLLIPDPTNPTGWMLTIGPPRPEDPPLPSGPAAR